VLDHVGNCHRHGLPTDDREWSLEGVSKRSKEAAPSVRVCPSCFCAMRSGTAECPECGHVFAPERRELEHVEGELVEVTGWEKQRFNIKPGDEVYKVDCYRRLFGPYIVKRFTKCHVVCHKDRDHSCEYHLRNEEILKPPFRKGDVIIRKNHDTKEWESGWTIGKYNPAKQSALVVRSDQYDETREYSFQVGGEVRLLTKGNFRLDDGQPLPLKAEQSSAETLSDLVAIGHRRGMANPHGWARHVLAAREAKRARSGPVRVVA